MDVSSSSLSISLDFSSSSSDFSLSVDVQSTDTTSTISATLDGYYEITPTEDQIQISVPGTGMLGSEYYEDMRDSLEQNDISLTLKVPSDASVSGLPSGYQEDDGTYTWTGNDAADAIASIATGQAAGAEITYEYVPESELPWMWIGVGVVIIVALVAAAMVARR